MDTEALNRPAALQLFEGASRTLSSPAELFATLSEAIRAAGLALSRPAIEAWIVTEEGEMLSPVWIRTYLN